MPASVVSGAAMVSLPPPSAGMNPAPHKKVRAFRYRGAPAGRVHRVASLPLASVPWPDCPLWGRLYAGQRGVRRRRGIAPTPVGRDEPGPTQGRCKPAAGLSALAGLSIVGPALRRP